MKNKLLLLCYVILVLFSEAVCAEAAARGWVKHVIGEQKSPIYLDVKDMDGDGLLDVASTTNMHPNLFDSEVAWFRNNGTASKWDKTIISSSEKQDNPIQNANGIVIADIDSDGHLDVVVATGRATEAIGSVYWFKAPDDPAGEWQRFTIELAVLNSYFKVYTMDINGDGRQDVIAGGTQLGSAVFLNPGNPEQPGAVWTKLPLVESNTPKTGSSLYLDDMNNDGKTDILNTYTGKEEGDPGNVSWFKNLSDNGTVVLERKMVGPEVVLRAFDINAMDVNDDGKKDILVSTFKQKNTFWYEAPQNDNGTWTEHLISDTFDGTDMYTGDVNGDNKTDFVISGLIALKVSWFEYSTENDTWTEHLIDRVYLPGDISLNDIDNDGDLDVVLAGLGANQIIWYENRLNEAPQCVLTYLLGKDSPSLAPLRKVRDTVKLSMPGGEGLVAAYYAYSPTLIKSIKAFKSILRTS